MICSFKLGKTHGKIRIPDEAWQIMVQDIVSDMQLNQMDKVLELCCGNGLISHAIAPFVKEIKSIDYTKRLIKEAQNLIVDLILLLFVQKLIIIFQHFFKIIILNLQKFLMGDL